MGSGADWGPVADRLAGDADVLAPDLPGHGGAVDLPDAAYTMDGAADRLAALLDGPAVVAGYSMGGRLALHLALRRPDRVVALVLVSASPGLATAEERATRRALDAERAEEIENDFDGFLDRWYRAPLWGDLPDSVRQSLVARRRANRPDELARSLRGMGTGAQPSHWDRLTHLPCPAQALAGERDDKYVRIAHAMGARGPVAPVVVPGAGHALLAEAPGAVAAAVRPLLGSNARGVAFAPSTRPL